MFITREFSNYSKVALTRIEGLVVGLIMASALEVLTFAIIPSTILALASHSADTSSNSIISLNLTGLQLKLTHSIAYLSITLLCILTILVRCIVNRWAVNLEIVLSSEVHKKLGRLASIWVDNNQDEKTLLFVQTYNLTALGSEITEQYAKSFHYYSYCVSTAISCLTFAVASIALNTFTILILVAILLAHFLVFRRIEKRMRSASESYAGNIAKLNNELVTIQSNIKYLVFSSCEEWLRSRLKRKSDEFLEKKRKLGRVVAFNAAVKQPFLLLIIFWGVLLQYSIEPNSILAAGTSLLLAFKALNYYSSYQGYKQNWNAFSGSKSVIDQLCEISESLETDDLNKIEPDRVEMDSVILDNLSVVSPKTYSFTIRKGDFVRIYGPSGSGKTTLLETIMKRRKHSAGSVSWFQSLGTSQTFESRIEYNRLSRVSYISSSPAIFQGSIWDNITLGGARDRVSISLFQRAITAAAADDFLNLNSDDKFLDNYSVNGLSSGQRQRIAIARELYRNPFFLMMDEATSSLDTRTEEAIFARIRSLYPNLALVIITHSDLGGSLTPRVIRV